jgi:hypothetical protein
MVTPIPAMSALVAVNPLIAAVLYVLPGVNVGLFTTGAATALPRQANVSEVERRLAFSLFMSVPKNIFRRFEGLRSDSYGVLQTSCHLADGKFSCFISMT